MTQVGGLFLPVFLVFILLCVRLNLHLYCVSVFICIVSVCIGKFTMPRVSKDFMFYVFGGKLIFSVLMVLPY